MTAPRIDLDRQLKLRVLVARFEQLDAALDGLRDECDRLIGAGKKVIVFVSRGIRSEQENLAPSSAPSV